MGNVIYALFNTISLVIDFIAFILGVLLSLLVNLGTYLALVFDSILLLPGYVYPFIVAFISLNVIQYILNRRS